MIRAGRQTGLVVGAAAALLAALLLAATGGGGDAQGAREPREPRAAPTSS